MRAMPSLGAVTVVIAAGVLGCASHKGATNAKGGSGEVRHFADHIIAERGVRYGRVVMIPTAPDKKPKARKHGHHHD